MFSAPGIDCVLALFHLSTPVFLLTYSLSSGLFFFLSSCWCFHKLRRLLLSVEDSISGKASVVSLLLNDALSMEIIHRWEDDWRIGRKFRGLILYLPARTEENHEILSQNSLCLGRDWNRAPPEHESEALLLDCDWHCDLVVTTCGDVYGEVSEPWRPFQISLLI